MCVTNSHDMSDYYNQKNKKVLTLLKCCLNLKLSNKYS